MIKKIFLFLFIAVNSYYSFAQQITPFVVNSCGSTFSSSSVVLSFNVGEAAVTKISNGTNTITQGFLQAKVNPISINENNADSHFSVFPNPVSSEVKIQALNYDKAFTIKLIDAIGHTTYNGLAKDNTISMAQLPTGIYELLIFDEGQKLIERKTIIKID